MRYDAGEVITAMVTPFNEKREVDYDKVEFLANYLVENGSDAVLVTGTTGESPTLTFDEELEILSSAKRAVSSKGKVIMGAGSNSTETASECPTKTGTRTAVQEILTFSSKWRIFLVSFVTFISSFVYPFSQNTSIWGITLKAISYLNAEGS